MARGKVVELGFTGPTRLFVSVSSSLADYNEALALLGCMPAGVARATDNVPLLQPEEQVLQFEPAEIAARADRRAIEKLSVSRLRSYILSMYTAHHEIVHVQQAATTTVGFALAIDSLDLVMKAIVIVRELASRGASSLRLPLSRAHLSVSGRGVTRIRRHFARVFLRHRHRHAMAFSGRSGKSVGEVIAYQLDRAMANGSQQHYITALTPNAPSSPAGLTIEHLLEASAAVQATSHVLPVWYHAGVPEQVLNELNNEIMSEPRYSYAMRVFIEYLGITVFTPALLDLFQVVVHTALCPAGVFSHRDVHSAGPFRWEDVQPCWRFVRLLDHLRTRGLPTDIRESYGTFVATSLADERLPTPAQVAERTIEQFAAPAPMDVGTRDLLDRHLSVCRLLQSNPVSVALGRLNRGLTARLLPWFQIKGDRALFRQSPIVADGEDGVVVAANLAYVFSVGEDMLVERDVSKSSRLFDTLWAALKSSGHIGQMPSEREREAQFTELFGFDRKLKRPQGRP